MILCVAVLFSFLACHHICITVVCVVILLRYTSWTMLGHSPTPQCRKDRLISLRCLCLQFMKYWIVYTSRHFHSGRGCNSVVAETSCAVWRYEVVISRFMMVERIGCGDFLHASQKQSDCGFVTTFPLICVQSLQVADLGFRSLLWHLSCHVAFCWFRFVVLLPTQDKSVL